MNYPFDPRGCVVGRNMVNRVRTAASLHSRKHPLSAQNPQLAWGLHGGCEVARAEFKVGGLKTPIRSNTAAGASQCGRSPERPFWAADPGVPVSGEQGPFSYAHRSVSPAGPDPVNPRNPDYFTRSVKLHPRPRQPRHPARKAGLKPRAPYGVRRFTAAFRRDVLVTSASQCWIIQCLFPGHDKRAPPKYPSEGPARQVRFSTLDDPSQFTRVPIGAIHEWPLQDMRPAPLTESLQNAGQISRGSLECFRLVTVSGKPWDAHGFGWNRHRSELEDRGVPSSGKERRERVDLRIS